MARNRNAEMRPCVLVINIPSHTGRAAWMARQVGEATLPLRWVAATEGMPATMPLPLTPTRSMSGAEIGCFLSHREAWTTIAEGDLPWALILEDDCSLGSDWETAMETALAEVPGADVLFCGKDSHAEFLQATASWTDIAHLWTPGEDFEVSRHCVNAAPRLNLHAYVVTNSGSHKLLHNHVAILNSVDLQIHFDSMKNNSSFFAMKHGIGEQDKSWGSSIAGSSCVYGASTLSHHDSLLRFPVERNLAIIGLCILAIAAFCVSF